MQSFADRKMLYWQCNDTKIKTSMSVFRNSRISTHSDSTCGQHAGQISERTGHTCSSPIQTAHPHIPHFGLMGELLRELSSPKWDIPCPGRRLTTVQNLTSLDLSLAEKSVTVQTNKITNSKPYNHTLPIGMCG